MSMISLNRLLLSNTIRAIKSGNKSLLLSGPNWSTTGLIKLENLSTNRKEKTRFYKQVSVCESFGSDSKRKLYEINLDKRKLRTPGGNLFQVDNELLAHMISFEWQSQHESIKQYSMHMTSLTNTCLDNPSKLTKEALLSNINDYLETDTIIYFDTNSLEKLDHLQEAKWRPLVDWFNAKYPDLDIKVKKEIEEPLINYDDKFSIDKNSFFKYLNKNFDLSTLIAFNYIVECLKSVILTLALLERRIGSVDEACELAMLEQKHQYDQWGKVEWYHDINEVELRSRVSAALLFIYLSNSSKYLVKRNLNVADQ